MSQPLAKPQFTVHDRVCEVVSKAFRIPLAQCDDSLRMGAHPAWDSMGHMDLIVQIEREFNVRFDASQFSDMVSIPAIVDALAQTK